MTAPTVTVARTRDELVAARAALTGRVAVVMTMGALHAGHAALVTAAHEYADRVLVTVFVNPLQFGAGEDLDRYPRTLDADLAICAGAGVDLVFAPDVAAVYPAGEPAVRVDPGPLGDRLEGAQRPGHFAGVLTVVAKLIGLTRPDVALFGEKDAQQLALVRAMVRDLDLPVAIVGVPTVREPDGLALSSRNRYLDPDQRARARVLSRALDAGAERAGDGPAAVRAAADAVLAAEPALAVDYLALVDEDTFADVTDTGSGPARLLVAARLGATRLLDNTPLVLGTPPGLKE